MANVKVGKAKYTGQKKKYWKIKDGESVFRILPPLGQLADDGKWSLFYKVHYGYKNPEGKSRPFQSSLVINRNNKMVESPDAAQERIDKFKAELEKAKKGGDKKTADALMAFVGGAKSQYNLDSNHYVNAMDEQGNIGILKMRHRAKLALDATIRTLREKGIDPLSVDNGRFFVFNRSGNALDTTFQVSVKKQKMNIEGVGEVERDLVHALSEDVLSRLGDEAAELQKLFRAPSAEQVAQIVKESDLKTGVSPNIDALLGINGAVAAEEEYDDSPDDDAAPAVVAATDTTSAATVVIAREVSPGPTPAPVTVEAPKAAPKVEVVAAQTTAQQVSQMNDADFLASLGLNN